MLGFRSPLVFIFHYYRVYIYLADATHINLYYYYNLFYLSIFIIYLFIHFRVWACSNHNPFVSTIIRFAQNEIIIKKF